MAKDLELNQRRYMSDEERVRDFQRKLYRKAKQERSFRFYILYDKVCSRRFLREAYRRCRKKNGAPGVDEITFGELENKIGINAFIKEIEKELTEGTYKPQPVLRVYIEKKNGGLRPLGIPCIKDRVIQQACKLVIEPIFEADFEEESYGFRPKRSAKDAMKKIKENLIQNKTEVLDMDLSAYFDNISHKELMTLVARRISDKKVLHMIKMWLKCPVIEDGNITGGKKNKKGTPQGGVISPLLANIYLNTLDKAVKRPDGPFKRIGATIVRYADDFVIMAPQITEYLEWYLTGLLDRLKLGVNGEKSTKVDARQKPFSFLGFTIRYDKDRKGRDKRYWNIEPSDKSLNGIVGKIREYLRRNRHKAPKVITGDLNAKIRGWLNYFTVPGVSYPANKKRKLRWYLVQKLYRFYKRKSQRRCKLYKQGAFKVLTRKYGLIDPTKYFLKETVKA